VLSTSVERGWNRWYCARRQIPAADRVAAEQTVDCAPPVVARDADRRASRHCQDCRRPLRLSLVPCDRWPSRSRVGALACVIVFQIGLSREEAGGYGPPKA